MDIALNHTDQRNVYAQLTDVDNYSLSEWGFPRVYALKGAWEDDHTFVIDRMTLGEGPTQTWTLTFAGNELNVRVK